MLLSDDVTYQFVLYCVVSKHLLLALSVLCLFAELTPNTGVFKDTSYDQLCIADLLCFARGVPTNQ